MKDSYDNKMIKPKQNKQVPVYVGDFSVWIPRLKRKVNPGDRIPDFPIDEAKQRDDFILVKEY